MRNSARPGDHESRVIDFGRTSADQRAHQRGHPTGSLASGFVARELGITGLALSSELFEVAYPIPACFSEARHVVHD